jgi:hypothetical protein
MLSLISLKNACVFSPCVTSVGLVKVLSVSHVMSGEGGAPNISGAVRALSMPEAQ